MAPAISGSADSEDAGCKESQAEKNQVGLLEMACYGQGKRTHATRGKLNFS